jgi:prepilin-type processing-associated H-X9-DG protein/prepilin-type N-terminal cleavage/methylation domain-containing protein
MSRKLSAGSGAFTLVELLIVLAIVALIAAILLPVIAHERQQGFRSSCLSNMHQIGLALDAYTQDSDGLIPSSFTDQGDWATALKVYAPANGVFRCPSAIVPPIWDIPVLSKTHVAKGYAINNSLSDSTLSSSSTPPTSQNQIQFPATTVAFAECAYVAGPKPNMYFYPLELSAPDDRHHLRAGQTYVGSPGAVRHDGGSNYAFVDGHARWYAPTNVLSNKQPNDGQHPSFAL